MYSILTGEAHGYRVVILILAGVGFILASLFEQLQMFAKYFGARKGLIAFGYNNAMKLMVGNRLGAVLYFFFIAISVDIGTGASILKVILAAYISIVAIVSAFLYFWLRRHNTVERVDRSRRSNGTLEKAYYLAQAGTYIATVLNLIGLTLPIIWSANFPQFRLTLANSGFIFNSLFTAINVFVVESYIASLIDRKSIEIALFLERILIFRICGAITAIILLLTI